MKREIKEIESLGDEDISYWCLGINDVIKIEESKKVMEYLNGRIYKELVVYKVFSKKGLFCEIEAGSRLIIYFKEAKKP